MDTVCLFGSRKVQIVVKVSKQANVQGSGIITGDVNISIQIPERENQETYMCDFCKFREVNKRGKFVMFNGHLYTFCEICKDILRRYNEKIKESM